MTDNTATDSTEEEKPIPGLFVAVDGPTDPPAEISEDTKTLLKKLVKKFTNKNPTARRVEVKKARQQRAYLNGQQNIFWNANESCWRTFENGSGRQAEEESNAYYLDVYGATSRAMSAVLTQSIPGVRFEPANPDEPVDLATARSAESLRKVIERDSDVEQVLSDVARYLWTDGRTAVYTRYTTSASEYGYTLDAAGKRVPNSRENITAFGVLEVKVPIATRDQAAYPFLNLSFEIDKSTAKALFPQIADKMTSGAEDSDYERIARQNVMSGIGSTDAESDQVTYSRTWLRPSTFREIAEESDRLDLEAAYPDGVLVEQIGDTFANARAENMDKVWTILHPNSIDSQAGKSLGAMIVPIQDMVNEQCSIRQESYATGNSVTYCDPEVLDPAALSEEESRPNTHISAKPKDGQTLGDSFFQSEAATLPQDLVVFFNALVGPLLERVSGINDALFGKANANNETASGIDMLRNSALGQLGNTYRCLRRAYTKVISQAVACGFANRNADVKTSLAGKRGKSKTINIRKEDMKGEFCCYASSDEGFPSSWSTKRGIFMQLLTMADNPQMEQILSQPKNLVLAKDLLGLEELLIPGSDVAEKVMTTIDQLLEEEPVPNIQIAQQYHQAVAQAQASNQPPPPQPPFEALFKCSIENDPIFDDASTEFQAVMDWVNSPDGQKAKKETPNGFANVRLYGLSQKAVMVALQQAAAQSAAPPPAQPKPPSISESVSFKDLPDFAKSQALEQLGFQIPPGASVGPAPPPARPIAA
jgi:hypothetical protein